MSEQNVEIVRRCYDLFTTRDLDALLDYIDPRVQVSEPRELPGAGSFHGHDGFLQAVDHWVGEFDDFRIELEEVIEARDTVITQIREQARGKQSGVPVEIRIANVFRLKDGKIVSWRMYRTLDEALAHVGPQE